MHKLLLTVPDKFLQRLDCILLTNEAGLPRKDRVGKVWSRKRKAHKSRILGRYHRALESVGRALRAVLMLIHSTCVSDLVKWPESFGK